MKRAFSAISLLLSLAVPASALEVKTCEDVHVGLSELIAPVAKNARTYKDDKVSLYVVDIVEPVCCAAGVAIVLPDVSDELGGNQCLAVIGWHRCSSMRRPPRTTPAKGLLVTIPTRVFNEASDSAPEIRCACASTSTRARSASSERMPWVCNRLNFQCIGTFRTQPDSR
ncbi:MAG: hypothetical protein WDN31_22690 [Hyphomicrobium sp.]